jgi:hypothetical protein
LLTIAPRAVKLFTNVHKLPDTKASSAIRALESRLTEVETEAEELKASIAMLKDEGGPREVHRFPAVRPGQFSGMKRSDALREYLRDRPGGVVFTKVLNDLLAGGLEQTMKPRDNRRYLTTTITQNQNCLTGIQIRM